MLRSLASIISGYLVMASAIAFLAAIWLLNPSPVPGAWFMAFGIVCAFCFAILGGYLTVLIADHAYIKHSLGLALLAALTGVLLMVLLAGVLPLWPLISNLVLTALGALLGGGLYARNVETKKSPSPAGTNNGRTGRRKKKTTGNTGKKLGRNKLGATAPQ